MLVFAILIRHIKTKLLKSCPRLLKLEKVAPNAKSCSKVYEHNLSGPSPYPSNGSIFVLSEYDFEQAVSILLSAVEFSLSHYLVSS